MSLSYLIFLNSYQDKLEKEIIKMKKIKHLTSMPVSKAVKLINNSALSVKQKNNLDKVVGKLKPALEKAYLESLTIIIIVKNVQSALQSLDASNIIAVFNNGDDYIISKLNSKYDTYEIDIILQQGTYADAQKMKFMNTVRFFSLYTNNNGKINIPLIDNILDGKKSKYISHARKSIINTIFGISQAGKRYLHHPEAKDRLILPNELKTQRYAIDDKSINITCPICYDNQKVTAKNINSILKVRNCDLTLNCQHLKNSDEIEKPPFKVSLNAFHNVAALNAQEKQIFFINNFQRITNA